MARATTQDQTNVVLGLIDSAGGKILHSDLVAQLNATGHSNLPAQLLTLTQSSNEIQVRAEKQPDGTIHAVYSRKV